VQFKQGVELKLTLEYEATQCAQRKTMRGPQKVVKYRKKQVWAEKKHTKTIKKWGRKGYGNVKEVIFLNTVAMEAEEI